MKPYDKLIILIPLNFLFVNYTECFNLFIVIECMNIRHPEDNSDERYSYKFIQPLSKCSLKSLIEC